MTEEEENFSISSGTRAFDEAETAIRRLMMSFQSKLIKDNTAKLIDAEIAKYQQINEGWADDNAEELQKFKAKLE